MGIAKLGFCDNCADWLVPDGWQDDGRYFCPTCLDFVPVEEIWKMTAAITPGYQMKYQMIYQIVIFLKLSIYSIPVWELP